MEKDKFVVMCRYECWTSHGIDWCKWYAYSSVPMTSSEANEYIDSIKKNFEYVDQKTKLKHEYCLKPYSEYEKEMTDMITQAENSSKEAEKYFKSQEYKDLLKKKRKEAKERKARQEQYKKEHQTAIL